jgi:hypothetical protein
MYDSKVVSANTAAEAVLKMDEINNDLVKEAWMNAETEVLTYVFHSFYPETGEAVLIRINVEKL